MSQKVFCIFLSQTFTVLGICLLWEFVKIQFFFFYIWCDVWQEIISSTGNKSNHLINAQIMPPSWSKGLDIQDRLRFWLVTKKLWTQKAVKPTQYLCLYIRPFGSARSTIHLFIHSIIHLQWPLNSAQGRGGSGVYPCNTWHNAGIQSEWDNGHKAHIHNLK